MLIYEIYATIKLRVDVSLLNNAVYFKIGKTSIPWMPMELFYWFQCLLV